MVKKVSMLLAGIFLLTLPALVFGAYPSFQYPDVPAFNDKSGSGIFRLYVQKDGAWEDAGQAGFDRYFRQRTWDITPYAVGGETVRILLKKEGGGMAHMDSALLNGNPALHVSGADFGVRKLATDDFDVADASGNGVELEFSAVEGKAVISLTARIEEAAISKTPFQYPPENLYKEIGHGSKFYTYTIDTGGQGIERQLFKEYSLSGSGHPSGYTYGNVSNDQDNLYVTIDFTADNTMDGDKDYAAVYVKTGSLLREFKVSAADERWGQARFTYTDKVSYEHKLYRFQIPLASIGDARELNLAFSAYGTASPPGGDFGRASRQYLVVYWKNSDIYGQLVGEDGNAAGAEFVICDASGSQDSPSAAYNSATDQYLVTWYDNRNIGNTDIYGQIVNANGSLSGGNLVICNDANYQHNPSVAYNSSANQYLVAWHDNRNGNADIYGQRVNANGSLSGGNFVICDAANTQDSPSVAYNSSANQYLVAWKDHRNGNADIYGQRVDATGSLAGGNFVICSAVNEQNAPSAAYNSSANQYLVVWYDARNGNTDIYGQIVDSTGSLSGGNFAICNDADYQYWPSAAYNTSANQYLVAWHDYRNGGYADIYGRLLGTSGIPSGTDFLIHETAYVAHVMANAFCPNYLVAFSSGEASYSWKLFGDPCGPPQKIPAMNEWGMILLFAALAGIGSVYYRRRRHSV
ncbi:MAG: hypothetical protein MUE70_11050 [Desulfobacterales bacterium]|nr:hypothetical protein [Desulfobacterales bacterium]